MISVLLPGSINRVRMVQFAGIRRPVREPYPT